MVRLLARHPALPFAAMRASVMICKFALVAFITKYLGLSSLGLYGLALGIVSILPVLVGMGMSNAILRDAVVASPDKVSYSLRTYWLFVVAIYALLLLAILLFPHLNNRLELALIVGITLFEHLGNDIFLLFSNLHRHFLANATTFVRGSAWILVYISAALVSADVRSLRVLFLFWVFGGAATVALFFAGTRGWPWAQPLTTAAIRWIRDTIRRSIVLYFNDLSFVVSLYADRYLVTFFLGIEVAGIYVLFWTIANSVYTLISMTLLQLQRPLLIKAHHEGGEPAHRQLAAEFVRTTTISAAVISAAIGGAFCLLVPYLNALAANYLVAFWLIIAGMIARIVADFGALALFTARRDHIMTLTNVVSVLMLFLLQVALVPRLGIAGAGLANLITFTAIIIWRTTLFDIFPGLAKPTRSAK